MNSGKHILIRHYKILKFIWRCSKGMVIWQLMSLLLQSIVPLGIFFLTKLIIDKITISPSLKFQDISIYFIAFGILLFLNRIIQIINAFTAKIQSAKVADYMTSLVQSKSVQLDIPYYENPAFQDTLHLVQQEVVYRPLLVYNSLQGIILNGLSLVAVGGLLIQAHWAMGVLIIMSGLPALFIRARNSRKLFDWRKNRMELERKAWYLNWVLVLAKYAKDIKVFNSGKTIIERFQQIRTLLYKEKKRLHYHDALGGFWTAVLEIGLLLIILGLLINNALIGLITTGTLVMYLQALQRAQTTSSGFVQAIAELYENQLFLQYFFDFLALKTNEGRDNDLAFPGRIRHISVSQLNFAYPSKPQKKVLHNISMEMIAGQIIGIVGVNGSGKSTLLKLIAGFYEVEEGRMLINGIDRASISNEAIKKRVSALFQDYSNFHFTIRESIQMSPNGKGNKEDRLKQATELATASSLIRQLPLQYDTVLGNEYADGIELSGGQWQKVALARALYKTADLLILDEPTSHIDALAAHEFFEGFREKVSDKIVLLATHRLAQLRQTDHIYLMDKGKIVEHGTFDELCKGRTIFRKMMEKQL